MIAQSTGLKLPRPDTSTQIPASRKNRWEFDASEEPQHNRFLRRRHLPPD